MGDYLELVVTFFKIGIFTFGGGMAMLPMLERECVDNHHWCTQDEMLDYYAIGQCTPGIIAVNVATFIGCKQKGITGGLLTTFGVILPSLIIILLVASCLRPFMGYAIVQHALNGIRVGVCATLVLSVYNLWRSGVKTARDVLLFAIAFITVGILGISPVLVVIVVIAFAIITTKLEGGNS